MKRVIRVSLVAYRSMCRKPKIEHFVGSQFEVFIVVLIVAFILLVSFNSCIKNQKGKLTVPRPMKFFRSTLNLLGTPCPSDNLILCTYFNSGMAGPITMRFYMVKIWTLRFGIKYSSTGFMPIYCANNGDTFEQWKNVIFGISQNFL